MKTIMLVFGTRPEAIKMCPLIQELRTRKDIRTLCCVTGQHRQMLDQVLSAFHVTPDYDLAIMKDGQTLFDVTTRVMEELKNVLAERDHVPTLIFDEVDTGVSGRAAQRVAEKLAKLSRTRQVLCVTHLPQLAAMADTHFGVEKGEENGRTLTKVVALDRAARRGEIARLSGGDHPSETMLLGAEELLCAAENFKNQLL